jgi:diguanylate cyclase (GGDEF)-like protein/PAS domain S-box-containing protein
MPDSIESQLAAAFGESGEIDRAKLVRIVSAICEKREQERDLENSSGRAPSAAGSAEQAIRIRQLEAEMARKAREISTVREAFEATLENVDQGIMMIDGEYRVRICNSRAAELLDLPADFMNTQPLFAEVLEYQWRINEFDVTPEHIVAWIRSGGVADSPAVYERRRRDGTILEIRSILLPNGGAVRTYADITERRLSEDALRDAERDYRSLFENAVLGIYRSTVDGRLMRTNPALARLNGYENEAALLAGVNDIAKEWYVEPGRRAEFKRLLERDGRVNDFVSEIYTHATRKRIWVSETAWLVRDGNGEPCFYEGTVFDASDRIESEARVAHLAHYDELTGLPNRAFFKLRSTEDAARATAERPCAILCLDLDRFKNVNDTLGHGVGDQLLCAAANRLTLALGDGDFVARLGGDEFAVIARNFSSIAEVEARAQAIIEKLTSPFRIGHHSAVVGTSIGIAFAPRDGTTPDELLQNADLALYRAKADGRGAYRIYDNAMKQEVLDRRSIEMDLRTALAEGEFSLFYQPLIRISDGGTMGFEALIRWRHPTRGLVMPGMFIPVAEETGLIAEIGDWVLRQACSDLAHLPEEMRLSVNLSPAQLRVGDFVERTCATLAEFDISPDRLVLEITESILMMDERSTLDTLEQLRAHGIGIALDDFGTGYSSLSYLQKFRFDEIKIDRTFVSRLETDPVASAVVSAVMALARDLDMRVVGEGVETPGQLRALSNYGCDLAQGYLLGRPLPARESFPMAIESVFASRLRLLRDTVCAEPSAEKPGLSRSA